MANIDSTAQAINPETLEAVIQRLEQLSLDMIALHELILDLEGIDPGKTYYRTILQTMTRACAIDVNNCLKQLGGDDNGYKHRYVIQ